jgi:hypothetical protein
LAGSDDAAPAVSVDEAGGGDGDSDGDGDGDGDGDEESDDVGSDDDGDDGDDGDDAVGPLVGDRDVGGADDDDEAVVIVREAASKRPEDDAEFDALLAATVQESVESRKLAARVLSVDNMAIPTHLMRGPSRAAPQADGGGVVLTMLRRKGRGGGVAKVETKAIVVPDSVPLARYSAKAAVRACPRCLPLSRSLAPLRCSAAVCTCR